MELFENENNYTCIMKSKLISLSILFLLCTGLLAQSGKCLSGDCINGYGEMKGKGVDDWYGKYKYQYKGNFQDGKFDGEGFMTKKDK